MDLQPDEQGVYHLVKHDPISSYEPRRYSIMAKGMEPFLDGQLPQHLTNKLKHPSVRANEFHRYSVSISPNPMLQGHSVCMSVTPAENDRAKLASIYPTGSFSNKKKLQNRYMKLISGLRMIDAEVKNSLVQIKSTTQA